MALIRKQKAGSRDMPGFKAVGCRGRIPGHEVSADGRNIAVGQQRLRFGKVVGRIPGVGVTSCYKFCPDMVHAASQGRHLSGILFGYKMKTQAELLTSRLRDSHAVICRSIVDKYDHNPTVLGRQASNCFRNTVLLIEKRQEHSPADVGSYVRVKLNMVWPKDTGRIPVVLAARARVLNFQHNSFGLMQEA